MSSGSCFPFPVMAVEILKKAGGTRRLGIATIQDRSVQWVARTYVERVVEFMFCEDSYGYKPYKSTLGWLCFKRTLIKVCKNEYS